MLELAVLVAVVYVLLALPVTSTLVRIGLLPLAFVATVLISPALGGEDRRDLVALGVYVLAIAVPAAVVYFQGGVRSPYVWVGVAWVAVGMVQAPRAAPGGLGTVLFYVALPILLVLWTAERHEQGAPALLATVQVVIVVSALLAAYQAVSKTWPFYDSWAPARASATAAGFQYRAGSFFGHPVIYASVACLGVVLGVLARRRPIQMVVVASALVGLAASGSRSGWVALIGGALGGLAITTLRQASVNRRFLTAKRAIRLGWILLLGLFFLALNPEILTSLLDRTNGAYRAISVNARTNRFSATAERILESPLTFLFGRGPGALSAFWSSRPIQDGQALTTDNTFLSVWYDFGLVGVAPLVALFVQAVRRSADRASVSLVLVAAASIGFFDTQGWPIVAVMLAVVLVAVERQAAPTDVSVDEVSSAAATVAPRR